MRRSNGTQSSSRWTNTSSSSFSSSSTLRSSLSSRSSSTYATGTHLPYVSQSVLVAHCIASPTTTTISSRISSNYDRTSSLGYSSSPTKPTNVHSTLSSSSYSRPARSLATTNASMRYTSSGSLRSPLSLSSTLSSSSSSSFAHTSHRSALPSTSSSSYLFYKKPIRLRERPLLNQISSYRSSISNVTTNLGSRSNSRSSTKITNDSTKVISSTTNNSSRHSSINSSSLPESRKNSGKLLTTESSWQNDLSRNISRNKYLIKFREIERPNRRESTFPIDNKALNDNDVDNLVETFDSNKTIDNQMNDIKLSNDDEDAKKDQICDIKEKIEDCEKISLALRKSSEIDKFDDVFGINLCSNEQTKESENSLKSDCDISALNNNKTSAVVKIESKSPTKRPKVRIAKKQTNPGAKKNNKQVNVIEDQLSNTEKNIDSNNNDNINVESGDNKQICDLKKQQQEPINTLSGINLNLESDIRSKKKPIVDNEKCLNQTKVAPQDINISDKEKLDIQKDGHRRKKITILQNDLREEELKSKKIDTIENIKSNRVLCSSKQENDNKERVKQFDVLPKKSQEVELKTTETKTISSTTTTTTTAKTLPLTSTSKCNDICSVSISKPKTTPAVFQTPTTCIKDVKMVVSKTPDAGKVESKLVTDKCDEIKDKLNNISLTKDETKSTSLLSSSLPADIGCKTKTINTSEKKVTVIEESSSIDDKRLLGIVEDENKNDQVDASLNQKNVKSNNKLKTKVKVKVKTKAKQNGDSEAPSCGDESICGNKTLGALKTKMKKKIAKIGSRRASKDIIDDDLLLVENKGKEGKGYLEGYQGDERTNIVDQNVSKLTKNIESKHKEVGEKDIKDKKKRIRFRQYCYEDFDLLSVLGHGGWGFVFLAELKRHRQFFAIKAIKKQTIAEDDDYDSIIIERKMLALGNINAFICKLFCTFETNAYLFFVMEFLSGGDLMFHVQHEGKFTEDRCRFYAAEIICAVRFLHNRAIVYRDLKLDNILLDARGHIRLVDFGMCQCRTYREEMLPSNFCGTPEYIAPEIIKGVPYNHSVDWWSFGVLLYEMAIGKMPFRGGDENELLWNVCYEKIHYPMFLSKELTSLLKLLLEREPSLRMGMATCKAGDICQQLWFRSIDWTAIEEMKVEPPFVPKVDSERDVQNFDADFTEAPVELSPVDEAVIANIDQKLFAGFAYTNPDMFLD